ncbi:MAG: pantoate--beta-alanine ligase [Elusimicrobia bacterium]|nr:pantoate--beta-alanine ligase [Elusimicrobiota bacterium]
MRIFYSIPETRAFLKRMGRNKQIGFVPTMGDLHAGHLSLIRRSKKENDCTVVSIFVNPLQFNQKKDYQSYHRDTRADLSALRKEGVDMVFLPSDQELYPDRFQTTVNVEGLTQGLCGAFRPGHFRGVATVVLKLFQIVQPARAYFGQKDYQQLKVIEKMVHDLNLPIEIVACPTVREKDGLALSSRNRRLSISEHKRASSIYATLRSVALFAQSHPASAVTSLRQLFYKGLDLSEEDRVEYFEVVHPDTLTTLKKIQTPFLLAAAVWIGKTRLIDNLLVNRNSK